MYLQYFDIRQMPFSLLPDTSYFFAYGHFADALNTLLVALQSGEGFIKVTGEVGTGKTLLCRKFMRTLGDDYELVYIPNPQMTPHGLLVAVAEELGVKVSRYAHRTNKLINDKLIQLAQQGKRVVLCIDEAQAMPADTIESLRLLTNLETEKSKLLHIILFAQPELEQLLNRKSVRQLKQRITFSYRLRALDRQGMQAYIQHRISVAGSRNAELFERRALKLLYKASGGIPRLINILCHKSMLLAYGEGRHSINRRIVRYAIKDTQDSVAVPAGLFAWRRLFTGLTALVLIVTLSGYIGWIN